MASYNTRKVNAGDETLRVKDSERQYKELLEKGNAALRNEDLDRAEEHFAAALKIVHVKDPEVDPEVDQYLKEAEPLHKLGDVYLKRGLATKDGGDFTKAAALCNAALAREDREYIKNAIKEMEKLFVKCALGIGQVVNPSDTERNKRQLKEYREYVEKELKRIDEQIDPYSLDDDDPKIQEVEKNRAEAIHKLFETIAEQRKTFIAGLVDECLEVMGPLPCKYALIGLGSQATGLVTPYSDLEFAILIEEETENNVKYFRNLTHFLHLKVINLGETILPAMGIKSLNDFYSDNSLNNWFYDSVTPHGFAFDGAMPNACKTPLGRGIKFELIHTPRIMTKVLKDNLLLDLKKGYHLASILLSVSFIIGEGELVDEYTALWSRELTQNGGVISTLIANVIFIENVATFVREVPLDSLLNVKKQIYRFSSLTVSCWALVCNIQPTTIWETIEKLNKTKVINCENAHHLKIMVSISAELRLRTYMHSRGQVENMSAMPAMLTGTDVTEKLKKVFYVSSPQQLMRYHYTAIPFQRFASQFTENEPLENPPTFFDKSSRVQGRVYKVLCDYQKARTCFEHALDNDLAKYGESTSHRDIAESLSHLGTVCFDLADYETAVSCHERALVMIQSIYCEGAVRHYVASNLLYKLGISWSNVGDYNKSVRYHEHSLKLRRSVFGESSIHPDIADSLNGLGNAYVRFGNPSNGVRYHEEALQMRRSIYGETIAHPDIAGSLADTGIAWMDLGDYIKSVHYFEQSLQMMRNIYGEGTAHPRIANVLNSLGNVWSNLANKKAVTYYEQSLQMMLIIHGENSTHPDIIHIRKNLGTSWRNLGDHRKAIGYYEDLLQIMLHIHGEDATHPNIAALLDDFGLSWRGLGDYKKALSYHEGSLQMRRSIYVDDRVHQDIANSLTYMGVAWHELGDYKKAVSYHEESLQMSRSIHGENTAHRDISMSLANLGNAWAALGNSRKAIESHTQSLQMMRSIYGDGTAHPGIARSLYNLGNAYRRLGDITKAISYYEQALLMMRSIYGDTLHPEFAAVINSLYRSWIILGDHARAFSYFLQLLLATLNVHENGSNHP
ncbi:uncharacterized protein LOC144873717 [Branchiostoma floridae x Branchiostoma japonicum]